MAFNNSLNIKTSGAVTSIGDGTFSGNALTEGAVLLGGSANAITDTGVLAKGKILVGDGTTAPTQLTVGANGSILTADSAQSSGLKWASYGSAVWSLEDTQVISTDSVINFTGMTTAGAIYLFTISAVAPATDGAILYLRTSSDSSTYDSGSTDYGYNVTASAAQIALTGAVGNSTDENVVGDIYCIDPQAGAYCWFFSRLGFLGTTGSPTFTPKVNGCRKSTTAVEAVRFLFSSGNLSSGTIRMYKGI